MVRAGATGLELSQETTIRGQEAGKALREAEIVVNKHATEKNSRDRAWQRMVTELNSQQLRELAKQEPRYRHGEPPVDE